MKIILILISFLPFTAKGQTTSDTLKYLLAQINILKTWRGFDRSEMLDSVRSMKKASDSNKIATYAIMTFLENRINKNEARIDVHEDSLSKYETVLFDTTYSFKVIQKAVKQKEVSLKKIQ